jgi:hypothetical protein
VIDVQFGEERLDSFAMLSKLAVTDVDQPHLIP